MSLADDKPRRDADPGQQPEAATPATPAGESGESRARILGVRKTAFMASLLCVAMLGFGYAMVPLYDLFCDLTGFGGRVVGEADGSGFREAETLPARDLSLLLTATVGSAGLFEFAAPADKVDIKTGEYVDFRYHVTNNSERRIVGQAIPSIVPAEAATYVKKIECFCFEQQVLEPKMKTELPVRLYVDKRIPDDIGEITLSYVYYDSSEQNPELLEIDHSMH